MITIEKIKEINNDTVFTENQKYAVYTEIQVEVEKIKNNLALLIDVIQEENISPRVYGELVVSMFDNSCMLCDFMELYSKKMLLDMVKES